MDADEEFFFRICVNLRGLRAKAFSLVLCLLQERIFAPMRDSDGVQSKALSTAKHPRNTRTPKLPKSPPVSPFIKQETTQGVSD
jgi:hypothetical protein